MSYSQPAAPSSGDNFSLKEHPEWVGALALVWPLKVNEAKQWNPAYPASETVSADIVLLDRYDPVTNLPVSLKDTMVFGKLMVAQLKSNIRDGDAVVLGRIGSKPTDKGPAWEFQGFTPGVDDVLADKYQQSFPRNPVAQPSGQQGPPQPSAGPPPFGAQADPYSLPSAPAAPQQAAWGAPPAAAAAPAWGAPAAPATPQPPADLASWPQGLADFLVSKGIKIEAPLDEAGARNLAATFQQ